MNVTREELEAVFDNITGLEKDAKEIKDEIKDTIAAFTASHGIDKLAFAKFMKEFAEYRKDQNKYTDTDLGCDQLMITVCPELAPN